MNTSAFALNNQIMNQHFKKVRLIGIGILVIGILVATISFFLANSAVFSPASKSTTVSKQHIDESLTLHSESTAPNVKNTMMPAAAVIGCFLEVTSSKTNPTSSTTDYVIDIKNTGTQTCQNVSMSTYYASAEKFVVGTPKPKSSNYYWVLGQIGSGGTSHVAFTTNKLSSNTEITESCVTADNARQDACTTYSATGTTPPNPAPEVPPVSNPPTPPVVLSEKESGVWVWKSAIQMDQTYRDFVLTTAVQNNFNAIYVTIDDYLSIVTLPDGASKNDQKKKYMDALELLVQQASQKGIAVDAETGWRDWAESANIYKPFAMVDFVKEYNATRTYKLRNLQYDIEPYLMPTYEKNKATLLKNFVSLIDQTVTKLDGTNVGFAIVIPHFYDETQKWTPAFLYNKVTTFTFNHLLNILERKPGSDIILMSYRNFANGQDSTIEISRAEIEKATTGGYKTQVIVAQETGNVDPDYVTFYNTSKNYFIEQTNIVKETFSSYKNFGGMATHYLEPFTALK